MVLTWALVTALAGGDAYAPDQHLATITRRFEEVKPKIASSEDGAVAKGTLGRLLGQYLGEDRRQQAALSAYLRAAKGEQASSVLKLVRVSALWQAYLSSAVLALDGDAESKDLRDVLERRIARLLARPSRKAAG